MRRTARNYIPLSIMLVLLVGCDSNTVVVPTPNVSPTPTELPTATILPTPTRGYDANAEWLKQAIANVKPLQSYEVVYADGNIPFLAHATIDVVLNGPRIQSIFSTEGSSGTTEFSVQIGNDIYECHVDYQRGFSSQNIAQILSRGNMTKHKPSSSWQEDYHPQPPLLNVDDILAKRGEFKLDASKTRDIDGVAAHLITLDGNYVNPTSPMLAATETVTDTYKFWVSSPPHPLLLEADYDEIQIQRTAARETYRHIVSWSKLNTPFDIQSPASFFTDTGDAYYTNCGVDD